MFQKVIFYLSVFTIFIFLNSCFSLSEENEVFDSGKVKIILREIGNQLLISNNDSTSLILPVTKIDDNTFKISFEKQLAFEPTLLVETVRKNFINAKLNSNYRVEVIQCLDNEVAYSYEINSNIEKTIIPCSGRVLPQKCYAITIQFLIDTNKRFNGNFLFYIFIPLLLGILYQKVSKKRKIKTKNDENHTVLGSFIFYPNQNKLMQKAKEIALSKKECELLEIFAANINKVVTREELTKRVWEDNGVFVGRSLDTYISKLRKKLQEDKNLKLINIHGVGYKLETK